MINKSTNKENSLIKESQEVTLLPSESKDSFIIFNDNKSLLMSPDIQSQLYEAADRPRPVFYLESYNDTNFVEQITNLINENLSDNNKSKFFFFQLTIFFLASFYPHRFVWTINNTQILN